MKSPGELDLTDSDIDTIKQKPYQTLVSFSKAILSIFFAAPPIVPALLMVSFAPSANGLSIRDDVPISDYESQVNTAPYDAEGRFDILGSGTLITSTWVLGAAHLVNPSTFIASDGTSVSVSQRINFPGDSSPSNAVDGNDFALFELSSPINSITPAALHDPDATGVTYTELLDQLAGLKAVYGGGGRTGDGVSGATGARDILAGTNIIDNVGVNFGSGTIPNVVASDFDDPETIGPDRDPGTSLEMGLASGDSGGGLWADISDGPVLIGVHSAVNDPDDDKVFGEYGQQNYSTALTDEAYNWVVSTVPEPSSLMLIAVSGLLMTRRRRL